MGDIWPYGPPAYATFDQCRAALAAQGMDAANTLIGAAVGTAESSRDLSVIDDTPATGDYSVGIWQINYYASLYGPRSAQFGTPQQLVQGGITRQAHACFVLHAESGWSPWSTFNSGAYRQYLGGGGGTVPSPGGGAPEPTVQQGDTEPAVETLQLDLDDLGYHLSPDGVFGPLTKAAVVNFQSRHGLAPDGVAGPATWAAVYAALSGSSPPTPNVPPPPPANIPPSGPAGSIGPAAQQAWSSLALATGPDLTGQLQLVGAYASEIARARQ